MSKEEIEKLALEAYTQGWNDAQKALADLFDQIPDETGLYKQIGNIIRRLEAVHEEK